MDGSEDRYYTPISKNGDCGATFAQMGRNKRGLTLNPRTTEGQKIVAALVKTADVVVANLPPQSLKSMKLDYESLKAIKQDIILTTNSAFGSGGPYSDRVGFDGIGQAMSGAMYLSGWPDQPQKICLSNAHLNHEIIKNSPYYEEIIHLSNTGPYMYPDPTPHDYKFYDLYHYMS